MQISKYLYLEFLYPKYFSKYFILEFYIPLSFIAVYLVNSAMDNKRPEKNYSEDWAQDVGRPKIVIFNLLNNTYHYASHNYASNSNHSKSNSLLSHSSLIQECKSNISWFPILLWKAII